MAARHIENFIAALQAGEFEVAAWAMDNEGGAYADQGDDETAGEYLARVCGEDRCAGEYLIGDPVWTGTRTVQGEWVLTVTHAATGDTTKMTQGFHEGQPIVMGLPPLVSSEAAPDLIYRLFGQEAPDHVVVSRYNAFEVLNTGSTRWVNNPWAGHEWQVESGYLALAGMVVSIDDPNESYPHECPRLIDRSGTLLVHDRCFAGDFDVVELVSGEEAEWIVGPRTGRDEVESWSWLERGGSLVEYYSDAEGNLRDVFNVNGHDLIRDDLPGAATLSTDGRRLVYVDHRQGLSHFWSDVVVVRNVSDGAEVGRWALGDIVTCLEASEAWIVACLTPESTVLDIDFDGHAHIALAAIHIPTGQVTVVETRTFVYLPTPPAS